LALRLRGEPGGRKWPSMAWKAATSVATRALELSSAVLSLLNSSGVMPTSFMSWRRGRSGHRGGGPGPSRTARMCPVFVAVFGFAGDDVGAGGAGELVGAVAQFVGELEGFELDLLGVGEVGLV